MEVEEIPSPAAASGSSSSALRKEQTENLPWVEKYRPSSTDDLLAHGDIISTINRLIDQNKLPHLLFYGPPGTGKTSTILACARKIYGTGMSNYVMELNASDDRGIDAVRNQIKDFASSRKIFGSGYKLIILDEADQLTNEAQAALRRVIEKYTRNARFCLICNYVNKITPALQSRCTRFRFGPLKKEQISERLNHIATTEGVTLTPDGLNAVVRLSGGDMRKCINILQSTHMAMGTVDADAVYATTGQPAPSDVKLMIDSVLNAPFAEAYQTLTDMKMARGLALADIVTAMHATALRVDFRPEVKLFVIEKLADLEYRLATGANEKLQLSALVSIFQVARECSGEDKSVDEVFFGKKPAAASSSGAMEQ